MKNLRNLFTVFGALMLVLSIVFSTIPASAEVDTYDKETTVRTYETKENSISV